MLILEGEVIVVADFDYKNINYIYTHIGCKNFLRVHGRYTDSLDYLTNIIRRNKL